MRRRAECGEVGDRQRQQHLLPQPAAMLRCSHKRKRQTSPEQRPRGAEAVLQRPPHRRLQAGLQRGNRGHLAVGETVILLAPPFYSC